MNHSSLIVQSSNTFQQATAGKCQWWDEKCFLNQDFQEQWIPGSTSCIRPWSWGSRPSFCLRVSSHLRQYLIYPISPSATTPLCHVSTPLLSSFIDYLLSRKFIFTLQQFNPLEILIPHPPANSSQCLPKHHPSPPSPLKRTGPEATPGASLALQTNSGC
jgi:hypothetical protein